MSKFDNTNAPHLSELLGNALEAKEDGERCDYCERGWGKGFHTCPNCGLKMPADYWDED